MLADRAKFLKWKLRQMKNGAPRVLYLQLMWEVPILCEKRVLATETSLPCTRKRKRTAKHYSKRHERRLKKQRLEDISDSLNWLKETGVTLVKLSVLNKHTKNMETIELCRLDDVLCLSGETVDKGNEELVTMMLYIKDMYNVSVRAYHELASLCKHMPRHYKLKQKIAQLNSLWNLFPTPDETCGIQQRLGERLQICLEQLVSIDYIIQN